MAYKRYLDTVMSTMPAVQARQIRDLLEDFKATGRIKNSEEYTRALSDLSVLLNAEVPKPSFRKILALVWHLCRSESHGEMLKAAKNDVEAAFLQADEIGRRLDDHHFFMMKSIVSDLEKTVSEQEAVIAKLKWLGSGDNEFSSVQVNTFSSSSLFNTARSQPGAEDLYCDNRTQNRRDATELPTAVVDIHGKKLILPVEKTSRIYPVSVEQVSDTYSYGTDTKVEVDNSFDNLIDGKKNTFWQRNVYLPDTVEKVTTVLSFNLGKGKDVNYMVVEGANTEPFYIEEISGIAPDGHQIELLSESLLIQDRARIDFDRSFVGSVKVTFAVYSYERGDYFTDPEGILHDLFDPDEDLEKADITASVLPSLKETLIHDDLSSVLNVPASQSERVDKYVYRLALDNVWLGDSEYVETGIFVSRPMRVKDIGVLAVKPTEETEAGTLDNTIEYDIIKRDAALQVGETRIPIPILDQADVTHERLVLTRRKENSIMNDIGALRFCPYIASDYESHQDPPVVVYKDGQALTLGEDWQFAIATPTTDEIFDWQSTFVSTARDFSNYTLVPQKMWVLITNPSPRSIYTVSYTIRASDRSSDATTVWLDQGKTSYIEEDGRVRFKKNPETSVDSEIYLQITLRRNCVNRKITPQLLDYSLLAATYA